ncbi:MAG TPA: CoA transferase [Acidimicrobiales bacterium]|nr:CoA transferase [Acidimicrobiales bacterium]
MIQPLDGYVVVDLSSGIAGAYCTKLLADAGADVVKVEPVGDGALFTFLAAGKDHVNAARDDDIMPLLAAADAVVWSRGSRLTPDAIRAAAPNATVTTITPFGLEGPWADRAATEFTLQAWSGGIVGLGRGTADRAPVHVGGQVGEWLTGVYAAIGTLVGRPGELVDVSMLEVLALCLTYYPVTYVDMVGRPFRKGRSVVTPGVETTSDGVVGLGVGTGQQWLDFCVMVGHPEWMEDRSLFANRAHLAPVIAEWMAERTTAEVIELASAFRIPHAPIGNGATLPETDHIKARGSIVTDPTTGVAEPGPPYRFHTADADTGTDVLASRSRQNLADPLARMQGLRVLDLTAFWAGPLCTHVLALLGAEVIHVESTARPDGTRMLAGLKFSEPDWWEQSGIFSGLNTNKKSVTLDLGTDAGKDALRRLIATCDVLVENYTPRVLEQLGLDYESVRALRPDLVMVRMPGFGLDGPWRDNAAFAFVIEDAAGLTWMTGYPDSNPMSPYCVGDPNAGLHALTGLLLAVEHRRRTGQGVFVEASMMDAALNVTAEQVIEYSSSGTLLGRDGNRGPLAAPQNLYLASEAGDKGRRDTWVAIAVATDDQWLALRDALGQPAWALEASLSAASGRHEHHDLIDKHLAAWCGDRSSDEIVDHLWPAGVPVAKVMQPHEQPDLAQLQFRRFFEAVEHPVTGTARHSTLPMRFSGGPERYHVRHAPLLGEHNDEILRGLGVSGDEIAAFEASGVIGRTPAAAAPRR